jgi:hypothetical protein
MSWLFSRALVEEYLEANSLDGEPFAPLNGNPTPQAYCAPDKMTKFSRLSRFGMMYKPLTESHGEELLTWYLEDFPAKTFPQPEKGQELLVKDQECGNTWQGLLAKYNPVTSSWKTAQCSLFEDLEQSLETFPKWGLMRNGELYPRQTWEPTINEKEFGLWLTPATVNISERSEDSMKKRLEYWKSIGRNGVSPGCLAEQVAWSKDGPPIDYITEKEMWPTPIASGGGPGKNLNNHRGIHQGNPLASAVKMSSNKWPTPISNDAKKGANCDPNNTQNGLAGAVQIWPTPTAHMAKETNAPSEALRNEPSMASRVGGQLNPTWVEWLMGWPLGWTDLKPLEMDKCHCVQQQLGEY